MLGPDTVSPLPSISRPIARFGAVETRSPTFGVILQQLAHLQAEELSVLLEGESGTGKEHIARAIHAASPRARGPFVAVNCSSITGDLIESELFGHKRGSFTGAHGERHGAFAEADGGTLLLDEIGDAPLRVQLSLLRALETHRIKPVGSDTDRPINVRILAATSRNLRALIATGSFRLDLYYRLAELTLTLPPLRERTEDIPHLAATILTSIGHSKLSLSRQAEVLLSSQPWPGNIRELRNTLKRGAAMRRGTELVLQAAHFAPFGGHGVVDERRTDVPVAALAVPKDAELVAPDQDEPKPVALGISFPAHVVQRADLIWQARRVPRDHDDGATKQATRALNRAALLCLATRTPTRAWPSRLVRAWRRRFAEGWATSEGGRGVREMVRELGVDAPENEARGIVEMVGKVGRGE